MESDSRGNLDPEDEEKGKHDEDSSRQDESEDPPKDNIIEALLKVPWLPIDPDEQPLQEDGDAGQKEE